MRVALLPSPCRHSPLSKMNSSPLKIVIIFSPKFVEIFNMLLFLFNVKTLFLGTTKLTIHRFKLKD